MPISVIPVATQKKTGKFKYEVIKKSAAPKHEEFPKHLLGNTVEEAEATFKSFSKTLNNLARSYAAKSNLDRPDIFGEAILGLARAKRDFDPERSSNFKTFAIYKIRDAIHDYIRSQSGPVAVPAHIRKISRWLNELKGLSASSVLELLNGKTKAINKRSAALVNLLTKEAKRLGLSHEELIERARSIPYEDVSTSVDAQSEDQETRLYARITLSELEKLMTEQERAIVIALAEGKTLREIGAEMGVTGARIHQKLKKMRARLKKEREV